jgi:flavin reductase (DIM6/NTAB) family NADH-FMN oxidoreductase RutF
MSIDHSHFRRAMGQFATGVTVVTTLDPEGRPLGLTVSSFCSVSLDPPLVLVCVDARSDTIPGFQASSVFGVSVLSEDQQAISERFSRTGRKKFEGIPLDTGSHGVALVPGAVAQMVCRLTASHPAGDHLIYVGEILHLAVKKGRPLLYHAGAYHRLPK